MPRLANHANITEAQAMALVGHVRSLATLEEVVRWGLALPESRMILEVVVQDEFTHDVVMEWRDGLYLIFDTT